MPHGYPGRFPCGVSSASRRTGAVDRQPVTGLTVDARPDAMTPLRLEGSASHAVGTGAGIQTGRAKKGERYFPPLQKRMAWHLKFRQLSPSFSAL